MTPAHPRWPSSSSDLLDACDTSQMRKARLGVLVGLAALIVVLPAAAGGNDWGTWTFAGHGTSWSGTVVDAHRITGVVMGLKSRVMFNRVKSFTLGGKRCKTSPQRGTGYCYRLNIPREQEAHLEGDDADAREGLGQARPVH